MQSTHILPAKQIENKSKDYEAAKLGHMQLYMRAIMQAHIPLEITSREFRLAISRPHFIITAEKARIACIHLMRVEDTKEWSLDKRWSGSPPPLISPFSFG
jgi:hypothetical protein